MKKIKTAVIGVGYLGKFHAEKYAALPQTELVAVSDTNEIRCKEIAEQYNTLCVTDFHELIGKVDAVSIVVPTSLHYSVAKIFLENKIHVLLEKPITRTIAEANELIAIAQQQEAILQIGHLERFNPVLVAVQNIITTPYFIESTRLSPFQGRGTDVNVILDLMIHDIDIIQTIVNQPIVNIHAIGAPVLSNTNDIVNARIEFSNGCIANVTASRVSTKQERKLRIFQQNAYVSIDLHNKTVSTHRKTKNLNPSGIPEILSEQKSFEKTDVLQTEIISFIDAISNNVQPTVTGEDGRNALATAIEITNIVKNHFQKLEKNMFSLKEESYE